MNGGVRVDYSERQELLYRTLKNGGNIKKLHNELYGLNQESFFSFMDQYINEHGLKRQFVIQKAMLPLSYGYKILNGQKHTKDRDIIIRLCIAMGMVINDVQQAILYYNMPPLQEGDTRDFIIITGITHKQDIYTIQEWLEQSEQEPIVK